jgi:small conductance mechanosensitive channel
MKATGQVWKVSVTVGAALMVASGLSTGLSAVAVAAGEEAVTLPLLSQAAKEEPERPPTITVGGTGIVIGTVSLDGRRLFQVAAPAANNQNDAKEATHPARQRAKDIEKNLYRVVNRNFDHTTLEVSSTTDPKSRQPIIVANEQYIMTLTTLDAQVQGQDLDRVSAEITQILRSALVEAKAERQINVLLQRSLLTAGIFLGVGLLSCYLRRWQQRLRQQQRLATVTQGTEDAVSIDMGEAASPITIANMLSKLAQQQRENLDDIQRRLLQLGQVGLWGGATFVVLDLFPYTRWLQPFALSAPLQIVGIGFGVYVLIRVSNVAIDRFFAALEEEELINPQGSQRSLLRVSTISRVLKSMTAITLIGAGTLGSLSLLGVNLVPLLAGAGIIGLAISFGSQNLIKDMINGFFILLEDQYAVGDVIAVGSVAGLVEHMNLRITQLRNGEGRLITIPNGTISTVENLSKNWSRVDFAIKVAYSNHPDYALAVIREVAQRLYAEWVDKIIDPPEVLGIDEMDHAGILIRIWIKTKPLQQWSVGREFRRRLKLALDEHGVAIAVPQEMILVKDSDSVPGLNDDEDDRAAQPAASMRLSISEAKTH